MKGLTILACETRWTQLHQGVIILRTKGWDLMRS
jgi:hypothetical protein